MAAIIVTPEAEPQAVPSYGFMCCHRCLRTIVIIFPNSPTPLFTDVGAYMAFTTCRKCLNLKAAAVSTDITKVIEGDATLFKELKSLVELLKSSVPYKAACKIAGWEVKVWESEDDGWSGGALYISILDVVRYLTEEEELFGVNVDGMKAEEEPQTLLTPMWGGFF